MVARKGKSRTSKSRKILIFTWLLEKARVGQVKVEKY